MNARTEHAALVEPVAAPAATTALLTELHHADHIIKVMLRAMTVQQQVRVGAQLEAAGVSPADMTRAHERAAVIAAATAPASASTIDRAQHLLDIQANAVDVISQADHADILLQALTEKLEGLGATPAAATIDCFATCTARAVLLMREAAQHIVAQVAQGGAE